MIGKSSRRATFTIAGFFSASAITVCIIGSTLHIAWAAPKAASRDNYFPNTESLGADEMRVTALGTGTPNFRRSQASAAWLVDPAPAFSHADFPLQPGPRDV